MTPNQYTYSCRLLVLIDLILWSLFICMCCVAISNDYVRLFRFIPDIIAATATDCSHNRSRYSKNDTRHSDGQVEGFIREW